MGGGDWNDGMNLVGHRGQGESVWLTWFAIPVLESFARLAEQREDRETQVLCETWAHRLRKAGEEAWDGAWYLRGWYDDGTALGGRDNAECQIDSIAQSWAVIANCDREKGETALTSSLEHLVDKKAGIVKLFTPPFEKGAQEPGYIKGYPPGIRENGGQYTHGAVWLAMACFRRGRKEEGWEVLRMLLPQLHPQRIYKAEPYVLAGDIYSHPEHLGRGGWSWYTGSAGWYHQTVLHSLLGLRVEGGRLTLQPSIPATWPGWEGEWRGEGWILKLCVRRGDKRALRFDGKPVDDIFLPGLSGEHQVELIWPEES